MTRYTSGALNFYRTNGTKDYLRRELLLSGEVSNKRKNNEER